VYGKSKLAGEEEALRICERSTVLRLAWLYGPGGWNFTDWVVAELRQQRPVKIVTDQIGCPTWVGDVTRQVERLLKESAYGLYHSANTGFCSRYDWACEAARIAKGDSSLVIPVTSNEFKQKAPRPTYSAMDDLCLRHQDLLVMRTWQEALGEHLGL
jgi:dTDP-4-dehydrorhamnose reductase